MKMNSKIDLLIPAHDHNVPNIYRLMRHAFNLLSLFFLIFSQSAQASVDRLTALGGLSQAILDDSNGFVFPATISEWPRFEVELFDDWAGVAYPISAQHTLGLFFNRKTSDLDNFTAYIQQNGSDVFRAMSPSPWFDLAYGYAPNNEFALGASTSFAYDRSAIASQQTSASSTNSCFPKECSFSTIPPLRLLNCAMGGRWKTWRMSFRSHSPTIPSKLTCWNYWTASRVEV